MFWNALVRKDKADGADETDMDTVVAVHNAMNEATWSKILEWEKLREGPPPELVSFTGRPHDLSPKALLKIYVFGHPKPFDRTTGSCLAVMRSEGMSLTTTLMKG